jgi:lipopolysaccharide transport system ATP-binding protein
MEQINAVEAKSLTKVFKIPHEKKTTLFEHVAGVVRKRTSIETIKAVDSLSLSVKRGDFVGILGPNGSGKSTLLRLIAGILQPTEGSVETRGKIIPFLELGAGFNNELTAKENVLLYGIFLGIGKEKIAKETGKIIEFAEVEKFADTKLKNFSSGMKVRLAFSTAISADGDIYLVDEALAVGDLGFQNKCFGVFEGFRKAGKTIVLVTHNLELVERFCNRAVILSKGKVFAEGDINDIVKKYRECYG